MESTQIIAAALLLEDATVGVVYAHEQVQGKGRFDRVWVSREGDSLTFSLIFRAYADHPKPYLVGMAAGLAVARTIGCRLRWPNDLTFDGLKVGGILTQLLPDAMGRKVPVVGIGLNLNQTGFPPEIAEIATSLHLVTRETYLPEQIAQRIVEAFSSLPEPDHWVNLAQAWAEYDATPGKQYRLASGETSIAERIGPDGELICTVNGMPRTVMAAEAIFGA
ncbi:MAG: biotin--[acetyl-CoA-carboxylase] ligase [Fimbriimonas sp.]|nr:biotin--[acetyl-CoA-carboxylase] ligase [Fimbriimonas sp.]